MVILCENALTPHREKAPAPFHEIIVLLIGRTPAPSLPRTKEGQQSDRTFVSVLGGHCFLKMSLSAHDFSFFFPVYSDGQHVIGQKIRWRGGMHTPLSNRGKGDS